MATLTYTTTIDEDATIVAELARRALVSKTPPKDGQALLTLEFGAVIRSWQAASKAELIEKVRLTPKLLTAADKLALGIV